MPDRDATGSPGPSLLRKYEDIASPSQISPQTSRKGSVVNIASDYSRNVSFLKESDVSSAYKEHNPPTMLRKQEAIRRDSDFNQGASDSETPTNIPSTVTQPQLSTLKRTMRSKLHESELNRPSPVGTSESVTKPSAKPGSKSRSRSHSIAEDHKPTVSSPLSQSSTAQPNFPAQEFEKLTDAQQQRRVSKGKKPAIDKKEELHILIGVTGSVATIKVGQIIHKLKQIYHKRALIQLIVTKASTVFFDTSEIPRDVKIWYDKDEWESRDGNLDSSLHISLRRWADILLVAPCSANTLAKLTYGICDNLLTALFRVWNPQVPILLAPAMNTHMYTNPTTRRHFRALKEYYPYVEILKPVEKVLVCGDIGMGGMREWTDIVQTLVVRMGVPTEDEDEDTDGESA